MYAYEREREKERGNLGGGGGARGGILDEGSIKIRDIIIARGRQETGDDKWISSMDVVTGYVRGWP